MPVFYRYINCTERKQLWSILLCQITLVTLSWYYIEGLQSNNECCKTLKREYIFVSPYIYVPDNCTWWINFWFRINRYTIYTTLPFYIHVCYDYFAAPCHMFTFSYIWMGLIFNSDRAHHQGNIFYRDAPFLLYLLLMVLYLENIPFKDSQAIERYFDIDMENDERDLARQIANDQCWNEAIYKIRQCDSNIDIKQIIRQVDEQTEKNRLIYKRLDNPVLPPPEQKKKSIFFHIFIYMGWVFLCALAVWNYILLFHQVLHRSSNRGNATRIL